MSRDNEYFCVSVYQLKIVNLLCYFLQIFDFSNVFFLNKSVRM